MELFDVNLVPFWRIYDVRVWFVYLCLFKKIEFQKFVSSPNGCTISKNKSTKKCEFIDSLTKYEY